jgi:hypothetical protein
LSVNYAFLLLHTCIIPFLSASATMDPVAP